MFRTSEPAAVDFKESGKEELNEEAVWVEPGLCSLLTPFGPLLRQRKKQCASLADLVVFFMDRRRRHEKKRKEEKK